MLQPAGAFFVWSTSSFHFTVWSFGVCPIRDGALEAPMIKIIPHKTNRLCWYIGFLDLHLAFATKTPEDGESNSHS